MLKHTLSKKNVFKDGILYSGEYYKVLNDQISEPDRKAMLRITYALKTNCNYRSMKHYIQGFQPIAEITKELRNIKTTVLRTAISMPVVYFLSKRSERR